MKVLITGAAGFIGLKLSNSLVKKGIFIVALDNLSAQVHGPFPSDQYEPLKHKNSVEFFRSDIRNTDVLDRALKDCEALIHLAAETGTGQSMSLISHYYDVNLNATSKLFELIVTKHVKYVGF